MLFSNLAYPNGGIKKGNMVDSNAHHETQVILSMSAWHKAHSYEGLHRPEFIYYT